MKMRLSVHNYYYCITIYQLIVLFSHIRLSYLKAKSNFNRIRFVNLTLELFRAWFGFEIIFWVRAGLGLMFLG